MATQNKQYVFDILVKDKTDTVQLLAYAIYCIAKMNVQINCMRRGKASMKLNWN